ncbi:MAG: hypothetical protein JWL86_2923 [Rhizobium sp.]|nr:hypothetical protein [Rhizobium sp.]
MWARFYYSPKDYGVLISYLYDLQRYQNDRRIVLDRAPITVIAQVNQQFEPATLSLRLIRSKLSSLIRGKRRPAAIIHDASGDIAVRRLPSPWKMPIHRARRMVGTFARNAVRSANVAEMHSFARKAVYDLLARNGDLGAALSGFQMLTGLESKPDGNQAGLDQLMVRLVPCIQQIEEGISQLAFREDEGRHSLVISVVVWGEEHANLFERYTLSSLLTAGNLPAISKNVGVLWHVMTTAAVAEKLASHPAFLAPYGVRFEIIPDELVDAAQGDYRYWLYGGLTHTSFRLAQELKADLHFLNPDTVYSENYFDNLYKLVDLKDAKVVLSNSFRTNRETVLAALDASRKEDDTLSFDARSLHALGLEHVHKSSSAIIVDAEQLNADNVPRSTIFMWRDGGDLAVRSAHYQPIFVSRKLIRKGLRLSYFTVDSTIYRHWGKNEAVVAATNLVAPSDDIGYFEISSSSLFRIDPVNRGKYISEFWNINTGVEFRLFGQPYRLPVGSPSLDESRDATAATEKAFARLYEELRVTGVGRDSEVEDEPAGLTIADMVSLSDAIYRYELRAGCGQRIDVMVDDLWASVVEGNTFYEVAEIDDLYLGRLYLNFLRLGLLDVLKTLNERHKFNLGGPNELLNKLVYLCSDRYEQAKMAGSAWGKQHSGAEKFTLSATVWGDVYVRNFMNFNVRSMLAPGNIPALAKIGACKMFIVTDEAGREAIQTHPVYQQTLEYLDWEFSLVPSEVIAEIVSPEMASLFYVLYGMLDHTGIFFAQGSGSNLFMIPVDAIVADGSLSNMANYRKDGFECCGGGNIVANTETFLPALEEKFFGKASIAISTEDLASLAVEHAHHYFVSQVISAENVDFGKHARELFWPVPGGVEIHSCFIHPLFVAAPAVARYKRKHYANVDYGMIPRIFSEPDRIKIISNTDEAYINNFASAKRRFDTTGGPFEYEVFLRAHDYTYPVQKALFVHGQTLKCRYNGITPNRQLAADVQALCAMLMEAKAS